MKRFIPQIAGVVDQNVDLTILIQGLLHDALPVFDGIAVGDRFTTGSHNFLNHFFGGRPIAAAPMDIGPQIIDDYPGTSSSQQPGIRPAKSAPGAGYDGDPTIKADLILGDVTVFKDAVIDDHMVPPVYDLELPL